MDGEGEEKQGSIPNEDNRDEKDKKRIKEEAKSIVNSEKLKASLEKYTHKIKELSSKKYVLYTLIALPVLVVTLMGFLRRGMLVPFYSNYYYCSSQAMQNNIAFLQKIGIFSSFMGSSVGLGSIALTALNTALMIYAVYLFLDSKFAPIKTAGRRERILISSLAVLVLSAIPSAAMAMLNSYYGLITLVFIISSIIALRIRNEQLQPYFLIVTVLITALLFGVEPAVMIFPFLFSLTFTRDFIKDRKRRLQYVVVAFISSALLEIMLAMILRAPYMLSRANLEGFLNGIFFFGNNAQGIPLIVVLLLALGFAYVSEDFRKNAFSFSFGIFFLIEYILIPQFSYYILMLPLSVLLAYSIQSVIHRKWELKFARTYVAIALMLGLIILNIYFLPSINNSYPLHKEDLNVSGNILALGSIYPYYSCYFKTFPSRIDRNSSQTFNEIRNLTNNRNPDLMANFLEKKNISLIVINRNEIESYLNSDDAGILTALRLSPQVSIIKPKGANPSLEYYNFTS